jgi:hypothetical protein
MFVILNTEGVVMEVEKRQELKERARAYGYQELAKDVGLSRQSLNNFFTGGDIKLSNFERLVSVLGYHLNLENPEVTTEVLFENLKEYGAPLLAHSGGAVLPLEETVVRSLLESRKESRLPTVLPYVLVKNAYKLDSKKLFRHLSSETEKQLLGYYLESALAFSDKAPLRKLHTQVKRQTKSLENLYLNVEEEGRPRERYERFENAPAKKWKVLTRDSLDSVLQRLRKWKRLDDTA